MCRSELVTNKSSLRLLNVWVLNALGSPSPLLESSLQIPSVFPEIQKATRNARVAVGPVFVVAGWGWCGGGAGLARTQR